MRMFALGCVGLVILGAIVFVVAAFSH
jgi:hypothetical protein